MILVVRFIEALERRNGTCLEQKRSRKCSRPSRHIHRPCAKFPSLKETCAHFGIPLRDAHTGGGDARGCLEVAKRLHDAVASLRAAIEGFRIAGV